jgi:hypothetical protein
MPRRRLLIASATTLPLLLATTGCRSADLFAGPDPLGGRPPLAPETVVLEASIAAEALMISRYKSVMSGESGKAGSGGSHGGSRGVLTALLAQHEQHLVQLRARLIVPAGASASESPSAGGSPSPTSTSTSSPVASTPGSGSGPETVAGLRAAERQSAATLLRQLVTVEPALAQLLASIAASDATHVSALAAL